MCSAPTPPDSAWVLSRHPLGSSSSWYALHNMIVLSIGDSCCSFRGSPSHGCRFSDILAHPVTEQKVFAPRRSRRPPSENEKYLQKRKKRKTRSCTKSLFVFGRVSLYFRLVQCFFVLAGCLRVFSHSAGCRRVTLLFCEPSSDPREKTTQHQGNMQAETLNLHVALVPAPST